MRVQFLRLPCLLKQVRNCTVTGDCTKIGPVLRTERHFHSVTERTVLNFNLVAGTRNNNNRFKYTKKSKPEDSDDEEEDEDETDDETDPRSKLITSHMTSLRADAVLKAGLGLARNKVDKMFYESKIRVNGSKILKKSIKLNIKDEVDLIKGKCSMNDMITVARVVVVKAKENDEGDGLIVKLRRYKNLDIDNYQGTDEWRE